MKKLALIAVLIALLGTSVAYAMETTTYSGTISSNERFIVNFTTLRSGDITATATFVHQSRWYKIWMHSLDKSIQCQMGVDDRWGRDNADSVSCTLYNAPAGLYTVEFWASSGKTNVTVNVTAETNP